MSNKDYVIDRIKNSVVSNDPWKHVVIRDFMPPSLYENMKKEIITLESHACLKNKNTRAYHIYVNKSVNVYPDTGYLKEYYDLFLDEDIRNEVLKKLDLTEQPLPKDFYSEVNFITQDYIYDEVHPDRSDKLVTMIHYLADEGDDESLGTFLYTPYKDGKTLDVFKDMVSSTPYVGNCFLMFAPKDTKECRTNHCMGNNSKKTFVRKSIQAFWIKENADWTQDRQSGRNRI